MKTFIQVLAGIIAGILLAILLPKDGAVLAFISELSTTILSMGRYLILPLMFFTLIVSVCQLQRSNILFLSFLKLVGITAGFTLFLVLIGIGASLLSATGQIPVVIDGVQNVTVPSLKELVNLSFPNNFFSVFQSKLGPDNNQFVPLFILAILFGYFFTKSSKEEVEPTLNLVDSLSRIFYRINHYFTRISFIWVTILTCYFTVNIRSILDIQIFLPLIILLLSITLFIILIIYPAIFYYTCGRRSFIKYLIHQLPTLLVASVTGDQFFVGTVLIPNHKDKFKISRETSGFNLPFLTLFSKSGTALISVISFIVILKSYSSLEITASQILWVGVSSFLISFCLPTKPVGSAIASLYVLCSFYGFGGMEDSFIILSPAFPLIASITTLLNSATIILINIIMDPEKKALA